MESPLISTIIKSFKQTSLWPHRYNTMNYLLFISLLLCKVVLFDAFMDIAQVRLNIVDVITSIGSILLLSFWVFLLPNLARMLTLVLINLVVTFIIFGDLIYYRYFQDFISIPVLMQAGQVSSLGESIETLFSWKDIFFFLDLIILIPVTLLAYRKIKRVQPVIDVPFKNRFLRKMTMTVAIFLLGYALVFTPVNIAKNTWAKGLFSGNWWNVALYNVTGIIGFHGYDAYRYLEQNVFADETVIPQTNLDQAKQWFQTHNAAVSEPTDYFGEYKGKNIIMIQAEALQNYMLGRSIGGKEITPILNELMKDSRYFPNFYHQTGQGRTSDADFSAHCSMHPLPSGSVFTRYADHEFDCMPNMLKSIGYDTAAFHAYEASFWNRYNVYPKMGYNHFFSKNDFELDEPVGWSLGDKSFFTQSVDHIGQSLKQPFYSFMITLSSHHPYKMPMKDEYQQLDLGEYTDTTFGDYLQSVHYVDESVGTLIAKLKAEGLWENTIFVLYGDHDNSITDPTLFSKFLGKQLSPVEFKKIRGQVPLIVHFPDGQHAGVDEAVGGQIDLAPTLLYLVGQITKDKYFMGNNLFTSNERLVVFRNNSFTDGKAFYMASADHQFANGKCYDYATNEVTDQASCKPGFDESLKRLNLSDLIITNDLIRQFHSNLKK